MSNPYLKFSQLLFTCVTAPVDEVVTTMLTGFNKVTEWTLVDDNGERIVKYFSKEVDLDFSLAYVNRADRDTTKTQRVLFWEPTIHPGKTVVMGRFDDGLSHSIFRLSEASPYTWVNVRIYDDDSFPACFFDYYSNYRKILRRILSLKEEKGWEFIQKGTIQPFENPDYYVRRLKKNRLNREIITEYMDRLGFEIEHDGFWTTENRAQYLWQERPHSSARYSTE